jgi:polysaccharide chain length determinant protein (PEP-CTERM system associated)
VGSREAQVAVLPGIRYSLDDVARLLARRAWLIVIPLAIGTAAAVAVGERLPKKYRSETQVMLVPQRIPENYVKAAATNPDELLASLQDQLLSRSRLERIIVDLNLYESLRRALPMEDVVLRMRSDITVETTEGKDGKGSPTFRILYVSNDAKTAQKATERLASLFIEENLRDRENVSEDTSQFLESQLQDARQRLVEQEKKLEEYRRHYSGQLPTQVAANLQSIQNAQLQMQSLREATDRARERRLLLERQLADLQSPDPTAVLPSPSAGQGTGPGETTAQQLDAARLRLQQLQTHYKPDHPDVVLLQRTIHDLEAKLQGERKQAASAGVPAVDVAPAEAARQKRAHDVRDQMDDLDRELADKQRQEKDLTGVIADYQAKLDAAPARESDLVELMRDHDTLQAAYQNLLAKREESKLAANLERRNSGEQFKVLDPARVPERPFSPNVMQITLGGAGGGLAIGLLLVGLLEYRDSSFKGEDDVVRLCQLPVLAMVPLMMSGAERRAAGRRAVIINAAAIVVVLIAAVVIIVSVLRVS